jgi:hypothetical protein
MRQIALFVLASAATLGAPYIQAQDRSRPPEFVSPEVSAERKITFRVHAPNSKTVRLSGSDIPGTGMGVTMKKGDNGVWEATIGPIVPGAYRYNFNVDGISVIDPKNPSTSESNSNTWSLVYVPGSEISDTLKVPHGAVAQVTYFSQSLKRFRRMHVYTPPSYEKAKASTRYSTYCTARSIVMRRGVRSAGQGLSSTI